MARLLVRDLDPEITQALKKQAAKHGRSAEAEHREILKQALFRAQEKIICTDFVGNAKCRARQ